MDYQGVFIGRKSCWSKRIRVRILDLLVLRERCNGALFCWTHVSGIACEKEINNLQHRILVGLVSAHCLARRGFIYLVYGVDVRRRTLAPNISLGCNKLPAAHACGQESRRVALPVAYIKEPSLYGGGGCTHSRRTSAKLSHPRIQRCRRPAAHLAEKPHAERPQPDANSPPPLHPTRTSSLG
jgi:hypothetical protein